MPAALSAPALLRTQDEKSVKQVPEDVWPEFRAYAMACYQAPSPALARLLRDDIATTYGQDLPSAVACLDDDFEACIAHLCFPLGHRRLFGEAPPMQETGERRCEWEALSNQLSLAGTILRSVRGDSAEARLWYQRARDLNDPEAERRLKASRRNKDIGRGSHGVKSTL